MICRVVVLGLLLIGPQGANQLTLDAAVERGMASPGRPTLPVLAFPEPGMDDTAAYQGYQTRLYRDSKQNTVQIYIQPQGGRTVLVWADAANESAGFTARDAAGRPARLTWDGEEAIVSEFEQARTADSARGTTGREAPGKVAMRSIEYRLVSDVSRLDLGWFLLGSMRVERDFVYAKRHLQPFTAPPFVVAEESLLVANIARLPEPERASHLALLGADLGLLRSRLQPTFTLSRSDTSWSVRIERPSLDGRNRLGLELRVDPRKVKARLNGSTVSLQTPPGSPIRLTVRVASDAAPLTPLTRSEIFNRTFLDFLSAARAASDSMRFRRLEREVRGVELLSTQEKLMAGLPNFATYFGRDMMMTALMMRPIWSPAMAEHVIASVLRKLGPRGDVSHEEALGGQAIRENAVVYDSLLTEYFRLRRAGRRQDASSVVGRARDVLRELQKTRENYHMIDDEFQLPVLAARYLDDSSLSAHRKHGFLFDSADGGRSRLALLLREMGLVAASTRPYVENPKAIYLVSFPKRDSIHWRSASWRDSDAGYAGGRFAMDINAVWVPQALDAISTILAALPGLGVPAQRLDSIAPEIRGTPLLEYARDTASLRHAIDTWRGARRHFEVTLAPREIQRRIEAKLAWLPQAERRFWQKAMAEHSEVRDSLAFLVLSLNAKGKPIPVVNTDPATELFLAGLTAGVEAGAIGPEVVLRDAAPFVRPYPVGLLVDGLGPLVANDAYASREIWERFGADPYHGPRVVWGREVNLLFLGLANAISRATEAGGRPRDPGMEPYVGALRDALRRTLDAVNASGLKHNELWSYRVESGRLVPTRYGTSSDVQLWNGTDLAVQFALSRLPAP